MTSKQRRERGIIIANKGDQITKIHNGNYKIKSQSGNGEYDLKLDGISWRCSCPDSIIKHMKCKHIFALEYFLKVSQETTPKNTVILEPIIASNCLHCNSERLVKAGFRRNKYGNIQKFKCKECTRYFTINVGFEKMKHDPRGITIALQLYFSGESLRDVANTLRLLGMNVTHQTVYNWIKKYSKIIQGYSERLIPQVSDTWRADEMFLKIKGNTRYMYALMDDETRFWIAQEIANTKYTHDVRGLFRKASQIMHRKPHMLITDAAYNFRTAYYKEWWSKEKTTRTHHVAHNHDKNDMNNNKMESMNGEVREREKVMRGLKTKNTPILEGYQVFHNYIRPHTGLDGKTPAEACGIKIEGDNKWITLIQNASNYKSVHQ